MVLFSQPTPYAFEGYNDVWGYEDSLGNEYAIVGGVSRIKVYDVTDPRNPILKYDKLGGDTTTWRDFKTYKNYLYAVCDNCTEGLGTIPLDSLSFNIMRKDVSKIDRAHNIYIDSINARLYAVGFNYLPNTSNKNRGIVIYDISNPAVPVFLKYYNDNNKYVHDIYVRDNIGVASCGNDGTHIYDFTDLDSITRLMGSEIPMGAYHHSSWMHPDSPYVYSANEIPLGVPMQIYKIKNGALIDAGNFNQPLIVGATNNVPHNPYFHDGKLFISYYEDGVQVYDMSKPTKPIKCAYYDTYPNASYTGYNGCWGVFPYLRSGTILASDRSKGLMVLGMDMGIKSEDIFYFSTPGQGFYVRSKTGYYHVFVDNGGEITSTFSSSPPSGTMASVLHNGNTETSHMVMKSPSGSLFEINFNTTTKVFYTTALMSLPAGNVVTFDKPLYYDDIYTGPIIKTGLERHRFKIVNGTHTHLKM